MTIMEKKSNTYFFCGAKVMKKMPFLIVKRTLFLMYFKRMHEIGKFHLMKIIKFTRKSCHENHEKNIKNMSFLSCKNNEKNAISNREMDVIFDVLF
jgi:hypothetical protein